MRYSRGLINRISNLHGLPLRIVYQAKKPETLLKNDKSVIIHVKTCIVYIQNNISPDIMEGIFHFQENENYSLRSITHLVSTNLETALFRKETLSNFGAKMWTPIARGT